MQPQLLQPEAATSALASADPLQDLTLSASGNLEVNGQPVQLIFATEAPTSTTPTLNHVNVSNMSDSDKMETNSTDYDNTVPEHTAESDASGAIPKKPSKRTW